MDRRTSFTVNHARYRPLFKRDYVLEHDDEDMLRAMSQITHEQEAIRMHNDALQAIEDAALAKALALSEETAIREARSRSRHSGAHIRASSSSTTLEDKQSESHNIRKSVKRSSLISSVGTSNGQAESHPNHGIRTRASMTPKVDTGSASEAFERRITPHSQARRTNASDESDVLPVLIADQAKSFSDGNSVFPASYQQSGVQSGSFARTYVIDGPRSEFLDRNGPPALNDEFDFSQELFSTVRFFAPPRKCCHCDEHVERVHNSETVMGLHAICTACRTKYCRGCFAPVGCPQDCAGGKECAVKNCCPGIRAIAMFDVLSNFTNAFALALREETPSSGYIKTFMRQRDPCVRQFEHTFVQTVRTLPRLLRSLSAELHPPIARIVSTSCLLRVMHDYLEHEDISNWMQHSETYLAILDTLKELLTCGLGAIFSEPFVHDKRNRGVPAGRNQVTERCLKDAVRHLDGRYKQIMALSARITFPATLLKMHKLSDGILYLLLQQIVN
ncbi:hypothetical protein APHAL10511_005095 [Amanita phalloides]|nr:hypothetical protein APHAL10511_005095 [Amanita phalloides]